MNLVLGKRLPGLEVLCWNRESLEETPLQDVISVMESYVETEEKMEKGKCLCALYWITSL